MATVTTTPTAVTTRTRTLLTAGAVAGPLYVVCWLSQALTREAFDPTRHPASLLANGDLGWIQTANFIVAGLLSLAGAVGLRRLRRDQSSRDGPLRRRHDRLHRSDRRMLRDGGPLPQHRAYRLGPLLHHHRHRLLRRLRRPQRRRGHPTHHPRLRRRHRPRLDLDHRHLPPPPPMIAASEASAADSRRSSNASATRTAVPSAMSSTTTSCFSRSWPVHATRPRSPPLAGSGPRSSARQPRPVPAWRI